MLVYDPHTGTAGPQPVEHVYVNHDANLVDVTLVGDGTAKAQAPAAASAGKVHDVAVAAHGTRAPPAGAARTRQVTRHAEQHPETIHTTTNHPWLTAAYGWLPAGFLRVGERVVRADGTTATVMAVRAVAGAAAMWDLTVGRLHTFAVGSGQYVVHNCDSGGGLWKRTTFKGKRVYQRDDLIDPNLTDSDGLTNLARMKKGRPPIGPDGEAMELHHMIQTDDSALAEVTGSFHEDNYDVIHVNIPKQDFPSGINRPPFNSWRQSYWRARALGF